MPAPICRPYRGPVRAILSRPYGYRSIIVAAVAAVVVASGCSSAGPTVPPANAPHPTIANVEHAAGVAFLVTATCHAVAPSYPSDPASSYLCHEQPKACDAPSDTEGVMGCWAIACSVELGLTTRAGNTLDFYLCWRYNPSCQSVTGGCPEPDYRCVTGRGSHLQVNPGREIAEGDTCPYADER
jgi:hypothetical protein